MAPAAAARGRPRRWGARALVTLLAAVVALLGVDPDPALSVLSSGAAKTQSVAAGRWSAVISATPPTSATRGAPTVSLAADSYWWVGNNGTVALNSRYRVTVTVTTTAGATARLEDCSGGAVLMTNNWNESTGTCSGSISVIANSGTPADYVLPTHYPVGAAVRLRLHVIGGGAGATATLNVSVSR